MICILCLLITSSALKLQQDPEFDITDMSYDEECGNRYNYKCWKKGGHSLDKHERAHFQMYSNKAVSFTATPVAKCSANSENTKIVFSDSPCGATWATAAVTNAVTSLPKIQKGAGSVISAVTAGVGCTAGNSGTAKPAKAQPTIISGGSLDSDCTSASTAQSGSCPMTLITVTTTALTGKKLQQLEMRGNGLHSGEKPLVGAAHGTKKCYSLACHDTATNCAITPLASTIPSVALHCASSKIVMTYYSNAACATRIAVAANTDNGYGAASTGLAIATEAAKCFQIGLSHWWCPIDFVMAEGAC